MGRDTKSAVVQAPSWINDSQAQALASYCGGEFRHMLDERTAAAFDSSVENCGDGLLKFILRELSETEGVDGLEEGLRRISSAVDQLRVVADGMAGRVFRDSVA